MCLTSRDRRLPPKDGSRDGLRLADSGSAACRAAYCVLMMEVGSSDTANLNDQAFSSGVPTRQMNPTHSYLKIEKAGAWLGR